MDGEVRRRGTVHRKLCDLCIRMYYRSLYLGIFWNTGNKGLLRYATHDVLTDLRSFWMSLLGGTTKQSHLSTEIAALRSQGHIVVIFPSELPQF